VAVRKTEDRNIRKISKIGKQSVGVTLPIEEVRDFGWREKQKVVVERIKGCFEIRDWRR
jgi:hypothetical protein